MKKIKAVLVLLAVCLCTLMGGGRVQLYAQTMLAAANPVPPVNPWDSETDVSWYDDSLMEFEISTPQQLAGFAKLVNDGNTFEGRKLSLKNDIFLNDDSYAYVWTPIGANKTGDLSVDARRFEGTFDGKLHAVYNMRTGYSWDGGLFGCIGEKGIVKRVNSFQGDLYSGGCIANVNKGIIAFCDNYSNVGWGEDFQGCGGICNKNEGLVYGCRNYGVVEGDSAAGIVWNNMRSTGASVSQCSNHGKVCGIYMVAGIVGNNQAWVFNCYNVGSLEGGRYIAGLVSHGYDYSHTVNCYYAGSMSYDVNGWNTVSSTCLDRDQDKEVNCYQLETDSAAFSEYRVSRTTMSSPEFIDKIDRQTYAVLPAWVQDKDNINGGLPITAADVSRQDGSYKIQPELWLSYGKKVLTRDLKEKTYVLECECYYNDVEPLLTIEDETIADIRQIEGKWTISLKKKGETKLHVTMPETDNNCSVDYEIKLIVTGDSIEEGDDPGNKPVEGISFDSTVKSMQEGQELQIRADVMPTDAGNKVLHWSSSDPEVASVNANGLVKALRVGTTVITAESTDGSGVSATCSIVVEPRGTVAVKVQSISLNNTQCTITKGQKFRLQATVSPANADNRAIEWTSDNPMIATVDANGLVTAINDGQTRVWASSRDGSAVSTFCTVTVSSNAWVNVTLTNGVLTIEGSGAVGPADLYGYEPYKANIRSIVVLEGITEIEDYTFRDYTALESVSIAGGVERIGYHAIGYTRYAYNGTDILMPNPPIIYCYGNSAAFRYAVANGLIYRLWDGAADIRVTGISLDRTNIIMQSRSALTLSAVVTPWNAANRTLRWSSSNNNVATVNNYGEVVALSAGTAVITASSTDGSGVSASCVVTVWSGEAFPARVERIILDRTAVSLEEGQSLWLQADVYPIGAENRTLRWTSGNSAVATVSAYGMVTAVSAGTAVITAGSTDGSGIAASCVVSVQRRTERPIPGTTAPVAPDRGENALYYVVYFNANGGTNLSLDRVMLLENERMGTLPTVQRPGYEFAGWYTMPDGGEHIVSNTIMNRATTLYAHWDRVYVPDLGKVKNLSLGTGKAGELAVSFGKVSGAAGYQLVYSTNKNFKASKTKAVSTKSVKGTLKNLKKGKTYYVKVRAYEIDAAGERVYGSYSAVKKAKVK